MRLELAGCLEALPRFRHFEHAVYFGAQLRHHRLGQAAGPNTPNQLDIS